MLYRRDPLKFGIESDPLERLRLHLGDVLLTPVRHSPSIPLLGFLPHGQVERGIEELDVLLRLGIAGGSESSLCRAPAETSRATADSLVLGIERDFVSLFSISNIEDMLVRRSIGFVNANDHLSLCVTSLIDHSRQRQKSERNAPQRAEPVEDTPYPANPSFP